MTKYIFLGMLFLLSYNNLVAQNTDNEAPTDLQVGEWTIDLRPTPDAEGYYQKFEITAIDGNTFTGVFYGSEIENGLLNKNWD